MAAKAKPSAMTKGIATDARATYLRTRPLTAALALLINPANTAFSFAPRSRFPQRAEHEADGCHDGHSRHRLVPDRLVEGAFEVARHLLHPLAGFAALPDGAVGHGLRLLGDPAELIGCLFLQIGRRVGGPAVRALSHDWCSWGVALATQRGGSALVHSPGRWLHVLVST